MKPLIVSILLSSLMISNSNLPAQDMLSEKIEALISQEDQIGQERKQELQNLADEIHALHQEEGFAKVTFVCTHNSRRSQLSQIWFWKALEYFDLAEMSSYSGGTESTAFNHRMVAALERFGFNILKLDAEKNPKYLIRSGKANEHEMLLYSKKFADGFNPQKHFIAAMVCSQADAECPFVPGAFSRVSLPYEDPKVADDTPQEAKSYNDKVVEIGREILYLVSYLKGLGV